MTTSNKFRAILGISTLGSISRPRQGADRQFLGSALALAYKGIDVHLVNLMWGSPTQKLGRDWDNADIVHLFNSGGPNGPYAQIIDTAREKGIPVVTTPVYWPVDELRNEIERVYGSEQKSYDIYLESFKPVLRQSEMLLPNSVAEMEQIEEYLDEKLPYRVVPNAVNYNLAYGDQEQSEIKQAMESDPPPFKGKDGYVICPARIEPRKNQWRLINAMKNLWDEGYKQKLILMGSPKEDYLSRFSDQMEGEKIIVGAKSHAPKEILSALYHADLMCLPSFIETPGLVALEALALDTNIAITDRGSTKEYFGNHVAYCDPLDTTSISEAIKKGLEQDQSKMTKIVREKMTYDRVSDLYLKIYQEVIHDQENK